ncbi:class I SAM-dependent methyltransferase [Pelagibius litoralis]|uniref:Class I SAM-dependent methyltransferase n=1 Tax=Pelagibius litoralis TaxID=374515 RepID=A0A967F393_9PROT|nr:class I SAM-dependent methyltransferase [Pelagibius litoralis]NIA72184.1 class I SAM-dependent methyltransferase [Pelagibius litoralis]
MAARRISGTEGYAEEAEKLVRQYELPSFAELHSQILHLIPTVPGRVLDIGAGTGRDAAALAARGHSVVAVEPTAALREKATVLHPSPAIEWLDDSLPELAQVTARGETFELILLTAVWMHLDAVQRRAAMPRVAGLLQPSGVLILSLRHGPVPPGRRMFDVTAAETVELAQVQDLGLVLQHENQDRFFRRPDVSWTRLAFSKAAETSSPSPSFV